MTTEEKPLKIVIVGGVALGAGVAAKARRISEQAEIVVFEKGPYVSFANCGLPYYLGGVIAERDKLLLHTPESLKARFNLDVRVLHEVVSINRTDKTVRVRNVASMEEYEESYDKLVVATGSKPIVPNLPGIKLDGVFSMRSVPDVDGMKSYIGEHEVKRVAVIGGGFIGLEAVENLAHLGLQVTLVEKAAQVLPPFDREMTTPVLQELKRLGTEVILDDGIKAFEGEARARAVVLDSGRKVEADMFVVSLGVRPDIDIGRQAGLLCGATGAIRVDAHLQTSDSDIYSGGDAAEIRHLVDGELRWIPLAGAPNKQGRVIAENIFGGNQVFAGAQGTSIVRVGDVAAALTGYTEKGLKAANEDFFVSYVTAGHHAGYYPGAQDMTIKLMVQRQTGRLLGAEIIGREGVDKRADVLATAITSRLSVTDIANLDLAYAPPFASAKDAVIMAAMAAENIFLKKVQAVTDLASIAIDGLSPETGSTGSIGLLDRQTVLLDVRRNDEVATGMLPGAVHIPLDELRERADELPRDAMLVVYCRSGQRSYFATRILKGLGFAHVYNLSGGYIVQQLKGVI